MAGKHAKQTTMTVMRSPIGSKACALHLTSLTNRIATWLLNFNIINSSNRFIYTAMEAMYRLCEPSLRLVRRYIPNFGTIDISPIVVYLVLWFIKSLLIEYWPR